MLHKIYILNEKFNEYFKNYDFHNLYKNLLNFCTNDLSAFYFDIRKDSLYCDTKNSENRKSTIKLLNIILNALLKWFAPILSFTTEEIFKLIFKDNIIDFFALLRLYNLLPNASLSDFNCVI
jgi:isoleucyl-tRNA synthetase